MYVDLITFASRITTSQNTMPSRDLLKDNKTIKILNDAERRGYGVLAAIV
jgi:hypothetical protein